MKENHRPQVWKPEPRDDVEPPAHAAEVTALKRRYYSNFDLMSFRRKRQRFWNLDLTDPTLDIVNEAREVVRSNNMLPNSSLIPHSWDELPVGTFLWRAREMNGRAVTHVEISESDLWEPPKSKVSSGRFNLSGEPLLYACKALPIDTLSEARITDIHTPFILVGYETAEPLYLRRVGVTSDPSLTPRQQRIEIELSEFLAQIVSIPEDALGALTYGFTQRILEYYYELEPNWESGWMYLSTLIQIAPPIEVEPLNVALEPSAAHAKLRIITVILGTYHGHNENGHHVQLEAYSKGPTSKSDFLEFEVFPHHRIDSLQGYFDFLDTI